MAIKVQGITVIDDGRNIINGIGASFTGIVTANTFVGSGASLTNISNTALTNSSVNYGGVTVSLGGTDATPAFNLSDAINYPYTSLTGITTEIVGDITPQLGGNLDINSKFITGTGGINVTGVVTATSFSGSGANLTGLTGASAATYGDAFTVPQIAVNSDGKITGISNVNISGGGGGGGGISGVTIKEEGSVVGTSNSIRDINFVSDNLTASGSGVGATITFTSTPTFTSAVVGSGVTINSSGINAIGVVTATTFSGSGANLTSIPNGALTNSSIVIGGVTLNLGDTDATPAFNLSDATAYPTSSLSGTITNAQLAGSIVNAKLVNDSVSFGGVSLDLGQTDATPAFNLSDATAYPYTSLTGITTSIVGDTTPQLGGNLDINGKFIIGTGGINVSGVVTATTFDGNVTGNVTGGVSGNAGTATSLSSARNFSISGDVVASAVSFDGTGDVVLSTAIQPNSVALATDTTGDFVQSITGTTNEVTVSVTSGENSTPQIGLPNDVTIGQDLTVTRNIDVDGHTELDDVNVSGIITASSLNVTNKLITTGIGISIANGAGNTAYIEGPSEIWIDPHPFGVGQTSGSVRIRGDLYVDGTEFIVNVDKIQLGDFKIGIATTAGTNALLDGGGLGIGSESIEKTITWNNATSALMSSENWNLASGKHYEINGTDVLTSNTLGSGIINSSLTSVGTLGALTVSGNVNANGNIVGDSATNISGINSVTATSFYGSGANLTSIPNGALTNSSVNYGGVTLALGGSDTTPAFDLSDATAYPTSSLVGTITNAQLAGSIVNAKLSNSSIAIGGVTLNLGDTDATPAFNLSDATAYPTSSLVGTITNAQLAGSIADGKLSSTFLKNVVEDTTPQLGGNLDLNGKFITGTGGLNVTGVVTASSLDAAISEWILGADGSSNYTFTGPGFIGAENDPSIYLVRGQKYRFVNNSGGFHPFQIRNSNGGSEYSDGVTNNGAASGNIDWNVQFDAPNELYYQCTSHSSMGGKIYIGNSGESIIVGAAVTINSSGINVTGVVTATTFSGDLPTTDLTGTITNAQLAGSIVNAKLSNSSIAIGGVTLNLGDTDATPAFNLSDATAYPTSSLVGTITNAQLAGSIVNAKLANDSVSFGGVSLDLGETDATPAFNLSDATAYPTSSLSGTITNAQLAGSIANAKLVNSTMTVGGVTLTLGATDATPAFNLSDATAYPTSSLSGTITNAQLAGSIADGKLSSTFLKNVVEDTTPQLGGNLDFNSKFITGTGGINVTGVVTATTFVGALTGTSSNASGATGDFSIADKIIHTGDTNTAIRFPAADTVAVETAGTERLRITSAGLVGIGTDNPSTKLHLSSGSATQLTISNTSTSMSDGATMGTIDFTAGSSNTVNARVAGAVEGTSEAGGDLVFETRADGGSLAERLRITSDGTILAGGQTSSYDGGFVNLELRKDSTTVGGSMTLVNHQSATAGATCQIDCYQNFRAAGRIVFGRENANNWQASAGGAASFLSFHTNNAGTEAERLRIQSGGGISFNGDTAAANALDDYEQGTWVPFFAVGAANGSGTAVYANNSLIIYNADYVKVGNKVWVACYIQNDASFDYAPGQGGTNSIGISGLPFTVKSGTGSYFGASIGYFTNWGSWGAGYSPMAYFYTGSTCSQFIYSTTGTSANVPASSLKYGSSAVMFHGIYVTA